MSLVIVYNNETGGIAVFKPFFGARLINSIMYGDGRIVTASEPVRADSIDGIWPIACAEAEWAETENEFLERLAARHIPHSYRFVDESDIPDNLDYFDALKDTGNAIVYDMDKAREIHRDKLRALRAPLFAANDLILRDAIVSGDAVAMAAGIAKRDELRDVTLDPRIIASTSVDELKTVIPEVLIP